SGRLTREEAQELVDCFILKLAECNKVISEDGAAANPGYTSGMLITSGGTDKDGNDASNCVTYMLLQASGRPACTRRLRPCGSMTGPRTTSGKLRSKPRSRRAACRLSSMTG
ncbi:MAG: hypothetical protein IJU67_06135, partial [Lachnospiraceae bacterium]|nr:hypothetical protein [Lachnospiraceae bacterium]